MKINKWMRKILQCRRENRRLNALLENRCEEALKIQRLSYDAGNWEMHLEHAGVRPLIAMMYAWFRARGAANFAGMHVTADNGEKFEFTMQRKEGLTPQMKYEAGLKRIAELEAEIQALKSS